jgi:DNA-binding ferritin-like protein
MNKLIDILNEVVNESEKFEEFSTKRRDGAEKIADNAKEKGGISMLTYYDKAKKGKFDPEKGKTEYKELLDKLVKASEEVDMTQTEFQRLVGKLEVIGELIIKSKETQK